MNDYVKSLLENQIQMIDSEISGLKSDLAISRERVRKREDHIDELYKKRKQITEELENK